MNETRDIYYSSYASPLGPLYVACSGKGITDLAIGSGCGLFLKRLERKYGRAPVEKGSVFLPLFKMLKGYFGGVPVDFDIPLDPSGSLFEVRVWKALTLIPWGSTVSYSWVAERAGSPKGARAVGNACGRNPIPIIIPCHRVLAADGLGGYTGGVHIKRALLAIEGVSGVDKGRPLVKGHGPRFSP